MVAPIKASDFNNSGSRMPLGYKGEHKVRSVLFDITDFVNDVGPDGTVEIKVLRNGEGLPYNATSVTYPYETEDADKTYVLWTITNVDTGVQGNGQCQLVYTVDNGDDDPIIKTMIYNTMVQPGIGAAGSTPNPSRDIVTEIDRAVAIAVDAKNVSTEKASEASISAGNASTSASNSHQSELNAAASQAAAKASADYVDEHINEFARIDGYYEDMTVGDAEQLTSTVFVEDNTPYIFRTAGGSADISNRKYESLVGGTIAWNQLVENGNFANISIWNAFNCSYTVSGGIATITGNGENPALTQNHVGQNIAAHVYFVSADAMNTDGASVKITVFGNSNIAVSKAVTENAWSTLSSVYKPNSISNGIIGFQRITAGDFSLKNCQCFDLTQMFGTNIANFIYSLEQAEAGKGVAFFRKLFPKSYYPYDAGSLQSVKAIGIKTTGFNQFDKSTAVANERWNAGGTATASGTTRSDYIKCLPSTIYYFKNVHESNMMSAVYWYDANKTLINYSAINSGSGRLTSPDSAAYIGVNLPSTSVDECCVNLSWSGAHNGEYEPYEEHSYDLDSNLELRGIPKLASTDELYYDGDEYLYDGTVKRKYGIADLGTLGWRYQTEPTRFIAYISAMKRVNSWNAIGFISSAKYTVGVVTTNDNVIGVNDNNIYIRDTSYSGDANALKTSLSGVYLVYELAEPTEETALSYAYSMVVNDWGTEEFLDGRTVEVPVGHETNYPANLRDKLQHLPDLAKEDGEYTILQEGTNMSLKKFDQSHKADIDGYYEDMTVGNAEQLVATVSVEDQTPYNFRTSGGSASIGDRANLKIVGGTIAWNQCFNVVNPAIGTNVRNYQTAGSSFSWHDTLATTNWIGTQANKIGANHKVFVSIKNTCANNLRLGIFGPSFHAISTNIASGAEFATVIVSDESMNRIVVFCPDAWTEDRELSAKDFMVVDLTQMFGSAIADYIYQLEQGTAGAGVAWFRKLFPLSYYPYAEGGLESVNVSSYKTTGLNQWDEEWELGTISTDGVENSSSTRIRSKNFCRCIPNATYYGYKGTTATAAGIRFYDANKSYVGYLNAGSLANTTFNTPEDAYYFKLSFTDVYGTTYNNDICINLSWNGSHNGEYEPYTLHDYPLDSSLTLRGIPKLDASGNLYYDGDEYEADGSVKRRYAEVDMGAQNWYMSAGDGIFNTNIATRRYGGGVYSLICQKYATYTAVNSTGSNITTLAANNDKTLFANGGSQTIYIADSAYTDAATFKTAMSGVYLVYELAEPTEETAEPFQSPEVVNDWGTEEFTDASFEAGTRAMEIPVGHVTEYPENIRDKVQNLPAPSDSGDGVYNIRQVNGKMILEADTSGGRLNSLEAKIPAAPTTDGAYSLSVTIVDGTPTYSWVSA